MTTLHRLPGIARLAIVLEVFLGIGALFGGGALILAPDGHLLGMPTKLLAGSPFPNFLVPGIILFTFVGLAPLLAAAITVRRLALAPIAAVVVGLTLIGWVSVEMVVLAGPGAGPGPSTSCSAHASPRSAWPGGVRPRMLPHLAESPGRVSDGSDWPPTPVMGAAACTLVANAYCSSHLVIVLALGWRFVMRNRAAPEFRNLCGRSAGATTT